MIKKSIFLIILLLGLSSCNDWLDVELDNKTDEDKQFTTLLGFQEALAGVYSQMSKSSLYGQALSMEYNDLLVGYYSYTGVGNSYTYWKDYDYRNSGVKSSIAGIWRNLYSNIGQLNCVLEWTDKKPEVLGDQYDQIRGEALGLRAYLHFDLYRLFAPDVKRSPKADGVPYNKQFGVSLPPMYSCEETIQLVINDLLEAERCLANDPITQVVPYEIESVGEDGTVTKNVTARDQYVSRMNLYAVKAMLARAYQARGEYTKAVEKAKEVMDCGKFRLLEFSSIDQSESLVDILFSDEHIFALNNRQLRNYSNNLHYNKESAGVTSFAPLPFANVSTIYESNNDDVRYSKWFDMGRITKFTTDSTNVYTMKMPMIKLSEMYLLATECTFGKSQDEALKYINQLRNHRIRNNREWKTLTRTYIYEEMKREYVGEGQLWYAYKRNNLPLPGNSVTGEIPADDLYYVFPFPDSEIENGFRPQR